MKLRGDLETQFVFFAEEKRANKCIRQSVMLYGDLVDVEFYAICNFTTQNSTNASFSERTSHFEFRIPDDQCIWSSYRPSDSSRLVRCVQAITKSSKVQQTATCQETEIDEQVRFYYIQVVNTY